MSKGYFITFEGGEGAGKSTQIKLLQKYLEQKGYKVLLTREPGGSTGGELIRPLLVSGDTSWDALTEMLLFSAARRDHLVHKILPAIEEGQIVLCDRFADSTLAYQGYGRKNDSNLQKKAKELYSMIAGEFQPNLTFILDIDPKIGLKRSCMRQGNTEQRFEHMDISFHKNLRQGFLKIAKENPNRCCVLNADESIENIQAQIIKQIEKNLCQN